MCKRKKEREHPYEKDRRSDTTSTQGGTVDAGDEYF